MVMNLLTISFKLTVSRLQTLALVLAGWQFCGQKLMRTYAYMLVSRLGEFELVRVSGDGTRSSRKVDVKVILAYFEGDRVWQGAKLQHFKIAQYNLAERECCSRRSTEWSRRCRLWV